MTDKPFQSGSLLLVDQNIGNVAHFNKKIPKKTSFYSCVPLRSKIMSLQLRILNLSKFLFQKCKSWDLTGNTFLCVSSILIDPQRHTVPPFKDKFIINNSFYKIEAIRVKL